MQVELSCRTREELHTTSAILKFQAQLRTSRTRSISAKWMEIRRCEIVNWPCHATFDYCFPVTCGSIVVAPSFEFRFKIKFSALSVVSVGSETIVFQWGWDSGTWRLEQSTDTDRLTKPHCRLVCVSFLLFFFYLFSFPSVPRRWFRKGRRQGLTIEKPSSSSSSSSSFSSFPKRLSHMKHTPTHMLLLDCWWTGGALVAQAADRRQERK